LLGLPAPSVRALAALIERDVDTVRMQCERPPSDWSAAPLWRTLHAAMGAFLEDDPERIEILLAQLDDPLEELPYFVALRGGVC
jgi:hypothetical protein